MAESFLSPASRGNCRGPRLASPTSFSLCASEARSWTLSSPATEAISFPFAFSPALKTETKKKGHQFFFFNAHLKFSTPLFSLALSSHYSPNHRPSSRPSPTGSRACRSTRIGELEVLIAGGRGRRGAKERASERRRRLKIDGSGRGANGLMPLLLFLSPLSFLSL